MRDLVLWDCNIVFGRSFSRSWEPISSTRQLLQEMDRYGIEKALLWHIAQLEYSASEGNELVSKLVMKEKRLAGCWTILPPVTGELEENFLEKMEENNIVALRLFPEQHRFLLRRRVLSPLFDEVVKRRIPVILSVKWGLSWTTIYDFLEDYPELSCILCDIGIWGTNRYTWPLLSSFPRVFLESSLLSLTAGALEATVKKFGAGRVIFGSGFPERYVDAAILDLVQAQLSTEEKKTIACGNLKKLCSWMKL